MFPHSSPFIPDDRVAGIIVVETPRLPAEGCRDLYFVKPSGHLHVECFMPGEAVRAAGGASRQSPRRSNTSPTPPPFANLFFASGLAGRTVSRSPAAQAAADR